MIRWEPGYLAKSKAGHDKGEIFLIIREEGEYVYLMDGKSRTMEKPKKKKKKHLQPISYRNDAIAAKLMANETVMNESVRQAIQYQKNTNPKKQEDVR